jgi:very-short-patch-repair endonuclease
VRVVPLRKQDERPTSQQIAFARNLRGSATDAESLLWYHLRGQHLGAKFRRQHPLGPYILDFLSVEHRLVIELDGGQHYTPEGIRQDAKRTTFLQSNGLRVLRYTNIEALKETDSALESIIEALSEPSP